MNSLGDGVGEARVRIVRDGAGRMVDVDPGITAVLGWAPADLIGQLSTEFIHPDDQTAAVAAWASMLRSPGQTVVWVGRYRGADGSWKWVEASNLNRLDDPDDPAVLTTMSLASGELVGAEEKLRERTQTLARLSDALPVGVIEFDAAGVVRFANDRLHEILGSDAEATVDGLFANVVPDDKAVLGAAVKAALADRSVPDFEVRVQIADGERRTCVVSLRTLTNGAGEAYGAVSCVADQTERVRLQRELERRATIDDLTGCFNRGAILRLLATVLAGRGVAAGVAVVFVDLDRFKQVNDRLGHTAGDRLLTGAAHRLRAALRDGDSLGRVGGDEFLAVCQGVADNGQAVAIAKRLRAAIEGPIDTGAHLVEIGASVGVAWTTQAIDPDTLVGQADAAMYGVKQSLDASVAVFDTTGRTVVEPRLAG